MSERGRSRGPSGPGGSQPGSPTRSPTRRGASTVRPVGSPTRGPGTTRTVGSPTRGPGTGRVVPIGFDPAKPPEKGNTRMELPPDAFLLDAAKDFFAIRGNKFNTEGTKAMVEVNQHRMVGFDFSKKIWQYDIAISPDVEMKTGLMNKIWTNSATKQALQKYRYQSWIFDGRKLSWAPGHVNELRFMVDLDENKRPAGATPRDGARFYITIRPSAEVHVAALKGYLDHKMQFNSSVQVALNFLDHVLRQGPSQQMVAIKRNFYPKGSTGIPLLDKHVLEVHKGTYASIRLSHNLQQGGTGLALNVDIANTVFWVGMQTVDQLMFNFLASLEDRWKGLNSTTAANALRPVAKSEGKWESSDAFKQLRQMRKLKFTVHHPGRPSSDKLYTIIDFAFDAKNGDQGTTARTHKFEWNGQQITVENYYQAKYNAVVRHPNLPLISAGRGGFIPMEFAVVQPMQKYPYKLNPNQTAAMIKIAVTRPPVRRKDIEQGVQNLRLGSDPFLKEYGISFDTSFTKTEARVLPPPVVKFSQGTADPKFSGRWDLRGKKFWKKNIAPLKSWGFIDLDDCVNRPQLQAFAVTFRKVFLGHGGVSPEDAIIIDLPGNVKRNAAEAVNYAHTLITKERGYTQMLFVVVRHKNSPHYERLKKSADCRFGILSQVINGNAVMQNNGQYHSNVAMKVNAKLGGATARTDPLSKSPTYFPASRPTMIIGVDLSHGPPGLLTPSTAAMTMSVDPDAVRYAAMVETNGYRVETLTPKNVHFLFGQLALHWQKGHPPGSTPHHIIYFRDGVSEGHFAQIMDQEVKEIKNCFKQMAPAAPQPKFTVIVATKRHHIRIFPQKGDKNSNPLPGTLVEREVTHPFMWDFYLSSHVAIQGTARPVHYHVLRDEMNVPVNDLQKMIYQQCYSYARSSTPVSLHPAIYYAHLAGARARVHEDMATSDGHRAGAKGHEMTRHSIAKGQTMGDNNRDAQAKDLLPLGGRIIPSQPDDEKRQRSFFKGTMWYI